MKSVIKYLIASLLLFLIASACSELQEDLTKPEPVSVHSKGFAEPGSQNFHSHVFKYINWDLKHCIECHGSDYSGGVTGSSCLGCHNNTNGPEACNTCHGDFTDPSRIAPPTDLDNNISAASKGVGAHVAHLYDNSLAAASRCSSCHDMSNPTEEKFVFAHIDGLPAEMKFNAFADTEGNAGYSFDNLTCSNTYCHGNFKFAKAESAASWIYTEDFMTGNNFTPIWNKVDGTQAACGTCHGKIENGQLVSALPNGHAGTYSLNECANCHQGVVDSQGNIIDKTKHINGLANTFGN